MFVVIINFPPLKSGKDEEFREWFVASNREFSSFKGFIGRRLLRPEKEGAYAAIVEFESRDAFMAMHSSAIHDIMGEKVQPLFDGSPAPRFYEVVAG